MQLSVKKTGLLLLFFFLEIKDLLQKKKILKLKMFALV